MPPSYHPSNQSSTGLKIFTEESPTWWAALSHLNPSDIKSFYVIGAMPYCPSALLPQFPLAPVPCGTVPSTSKKAALLFEQTSLTLIPTSGSVSPTTYTIPSCPSHPNQGSDICPCTDQQACWEPTDSNFAPASSLLYP